MSKGWQPCYITAPIWQPAVVSRRLQGPTARHAGRHHHAAAARADIIDGIRHLQQHSPDVLIYSYVIMLATTCYTKPCIAPLTTPLPCHHPHSSLSHMSHMPNPQYTCRARVVVPFQLDIIHHVHLRYAQNMGICVELNARERPKLVVEEDLLEPTVDVPPTCWQRLVLFDHENFLLQYTVVAIPRNA